MHHIVSSVLYMQYCNKGLTKLYPSRNGTVEDKAGVTSCNTMVGT